MFLNSILNFFNLQGYFNTAQPNNDDTSTRLPELAKLLSGRGGYYGSRFYANHLWWPYVYGQLNRNYFFTNFRRHLNSNGHLWIDSCRLPSENGELDLYYELKDTNMIGLSNLYKNSFIHMVRNSRESEVVLAETDDIELIMAPDGVMAFLGNIAVIDNTERELESQVISKNLLSYVKRSIGALIASGYQELPSLKLRFSMFVNHLQKHWTTLVTEIEGLDPSRFKELSESFNIQLTGMVDKVSMEPHRRMNYVLNFLDDNFPSNSGTFPVPFAKLNLYHFDSLGSQQYQRSVENSAEHFLQQNKTHLQVKSCTPQFGLTCGDHSVCNAAFYTLCHTVPDFSSVQLRELTFRPSEYKVRELLKKYLQQREIEDLTTGLGRCSLSCNI